VSAIFRLWLRTRCCRSSTTNADKEERTAIRPTHRHLAFANSLYRGVLLASILRQNLAARGVLFNVPRVIDAAASFLDSEIARRIQFVPGNFLEGVPAGGDLYILKSILHDWNDVASAENFWQVPSCHVR